MGYRMYLGKQLSWSRNENACFWAVFSIRHFLGRTLAFRGHLLSPTVSEANRGGRTDY
jgi:hypothetical protein